MSLIVTYVPKPKPKQKRDPRGKEKTFYFPDRALIARLERARALTKMPSMSALVVAVLTDWVDNYERGKHSPSE